MYVKHVYEREWGGGETEEGESWDGNRFSLGCPSQDLKLLSLNKTVRGC